MQGKILKGIAGFYYVYAAGSGIYECRARGIFRKEKKKPLVGDDVEFEVLSEDPKEGNVTALLERRSELGRPACANIDQALLLFAMDSPRPNFLVLDRFLIAMRVRSLPCIVCFNKSDLSNPEEMEKIRRMYRGCGSEIRFLSLLEKNGTEEVKTLLRGRTTVLAGPSGTGKSSLTNALQQGVHMETGAISRKLERGRNTTRHAQLIYVEEKTFICDTPGFSSFDTEMMEPEKLREFYPEFYRYEGTCRFQGCVHISEPDCRVRDAAAHGAIPPERYENYKYLYDELKEAYTRRYR